MIKSATMQIDTLDGGATWSEMTNPEAIATWLSIFEQTNGQPDIIPVPNDGRSVMFRYNETADYETAVMVLTY